MNTFGGYFFKMLPKRRRTEHTQFKKESKTKQNPNSSNSILIIHIQERKHYPRKEKSKCDM